ncbi:MAG: chemotaxis response regulator protein-glutamate methylesterase [Desulfuromonas sp.]|mgnify:CR=1 FL=1|uniref:chemotaxis-specific protein-glutamate methyltransferase CheB n=1 Tax=Desulfuromonas sp. TaxID=892 RepID=UPI000CA8557A|nr:chemotaxis-specific protein-glutamate methyltransferase CheB [Desulfuromonas sp.]PLX83239.1 MAG: chemotaxis response regulator protein-glutamate methylesterase [Desulfuromonas sp.]
MVKVLIADDSMLVRLVLKDLLGRDPGIRVIGEARDGRQAVDEACRLRPDLVIMDIMMPVMDGIDAVVEIMARCPIPILVLSSNVDPNDSRSAFSAIQHGALDVMEKPRGVVTEAFEEIAARLVEKVKILARIRVMHHFRKRPGMKAAPLPPPPGGPRDILAIGASTGGPRGVMHLLQELPRRTGVRILIVQHIARGFAAGFAEWLDRESPFSVRLAREGDVLEEGAVLVAPNHLHMEVRSERIALSDGPPVHSCRPSVDTLFSSLAREQLAPRTVAVLLSGMGRDGGEGMASLQRGGGYNIVQDEATSTVFGMPKAAIDLGAAHQVLPLGEIPAAIAARLGAGPSA